MSGCEATDEVKKIIRAMAKNRVESGITDAADLVDSIHEEIHGHTPLWKSEIADIISGYGEVRKQTKSEMQTRLNAIKAELRADARAVDNPKRSPEEIKNATRQTQLKNELADLQRKLDTGDFSKPERNKPQYDEQTLHLLAERNRVRNQVDNFMAKLERMNRTPAQKILGTVHDLQMASLLSSLKVFAKLGYAVGGGHALSLLADTTRSVARHVPGIKGIAEQAPRYGRGLDLDALKARAQGLKEAPREAMNQWLHGESTAESAYGHSNRISDEYMTFGGTLADAIKTPGFLNKASETTRALAGYVGRAHAAEKEFLVQPEFRESIVRESKFMVRQMEKNGASPEEIADVMSRESTQTAIGAKALAARYEAKMQAPNKLSASVDAMIGTLDRSKNAGDNFLGFLLKTIFPVRKIGVNVAIQGTSILGGGIKALGAALRKGDMTSERADYIMKNIGDQGAGAVLLAIGAMYYNKFGGVPGVFSKKDKATPKDATGNPIKPNETAGLGAEAFHGAPAAMLQIGASMAQVFHHDYGKHGFDLAMDAIARPTGAWLVHTLPYTDTARRMIDTDQYGRGAGEIVGNTLRGMVVPGVVQQAAQASDPFKGYRHPRNILDDVKTGIPGLREQVPKTKPGHRSP